VGDVLSASFGPLAYSQDCVALAQAGDATCSSAVMRLCCNEALPVAGTAESVLPRKTNS